MPFNFFQKKKNNRPDVHWDSKEKIPEKSPAVFGKKSDVSLALKKESTESTSKTSKAPQNMFPHVSEKSSYLLGQNSYVFKTEKNTNKIMLKKIVETHYGVKVKSVRILNAKSKKRMRGNIVGKKAGYKKAIVQLKDGHKIEF